MVVVFCLTSFNVNVSMSFPPDTNTPMLEKDDETKPIETAEISGTMQLLEPGLLGYLRLSWGAHSSPVGFWVVCGVVPFVK